MRYGSLFSGVGGLDLAVEQVLGASCAWHSEIDLHASKVLAAHWPGIPNHGDITAIDWTTVEPVDVLCGGFPCQDISSAGRMAGIKEGTRSGLWYSYADAVRVLRPRLVVVENVGALLVRGLDIVVGSLAELGYDATWRSLRASDVGAPHRRERIFLVAAPADADHRAFGRERERTLPGRRGEGPAGLTLPPTPTFSLGGSRGTPNHETARRRIEDEGRRGLDDAVALLLPTPTTTDAKGSRGHLADGTPYGPTSGTTLTDAVNAAIWGRYAAAVARWEHLTRPAPAPTDDRGRLNAELPEWMMGFDAGWITDVLDRAPALRAAGNSVCHQQAAVAIDDVLATKARMAEVPA